MWTEQDEEQLKELQARKERNKSQTKVIRPIFCLADVAKMHPEGVCFASYDAKNSPIKYNSVEEVNIHIRLIGFSAREFIARVLNLNDNTKNT